MEFQFLENTAVFDGILKIKNYNSLMRCGDIIRERVKRERANKLQFVGPKISAEANSQIHSAINMIRSIKA